MEKRLPRKLTVILYADVEGFSRLTGNDEDRTHRTLKDYLRLFASKIATHRGEVVHYAGDAVLARFDAVVNAISCALAVQEELAKNNARLSIERRIQFRIGINLGDVIEDQGYISGDGVNVAARLESLAEPGGVCVSDAVRTVAGNSLPLVFEDKGKQYVKNIEKAVQTYYVYRQPDRDFPELYTATIAKRMFRLSYVGVTITLSAVIVIALSWFFMSGPKYRTVLPLPDRPSIAVLPFNNMSDDPTLDNFTDGLVEDIITTLSRHKDLFVIARHSSFKYEGTKPDIREVGRDLGVRYVLEGSAQGSRDNIRVTAQLIDAGTGGHIWADSVTRSLDEHFKVQDEITEHIVSVIAPVGAGQGKLRKVETDRIERTPTEKLLAYDYFVKGVNYHNLFTEKDNATARESFNKALELNPGYSRAKAKLAWTYLLDYWNGWGESNADQLGTAFNYAEEAIAIDANDTWGHWSKASVLLFQRKFEQSVAAYQRALELGPNEADVLIEYGFTLAYVGRPEEGIALMKDAIRLNPYHPGWYLWDLAWGYFVAHRYKEAISVLEKREPKSNFTYLFLAACFSKVGKDQKSSRAMEKFKELEPGYSVELAATTEPFKHSEDLDHWLDALRNAGLQESI